MAIFFFSNLASISVRNVRNLHQLKMNGAVESSQMDIINRNASNSNLNYYTHPNHEDMVERYYPPENVYGMQRQQQQQQHQMLQQPPRSSSLRQSQSRSGSQRNLSQLEQQEQNHRVSSPLLKINTDENYQ